MKNSIFWRGVQRRAATYPPFMYVVSPKEVFHMLV